MSEFVFDKATFLHFLFVSLVLGGGAGWLSGRAIALTWRPIWLLLPAAIALGHVVRFLHFALFDEPLISVFWVCVDSVVAGVCMLAGYYMTRARQMERQYGFLHGR